MNGARFEVVRTDAPQSWHARFRAANGRVVWTTENYTRKAGAEGAILAVALEFDYAACPYIRDGGSVHEGQRQLYTSHGGHGQTIEVRYIDERVAS